MAAHKKIDRVCGGVLAVCLVLTMLFMFGDGLGLQRASAAPGYEGRLFDTGRVHTIDIVMDGWDEFIGGCEDEEYVLCSVVIDGEAQRNVGIRAKGNTSLTQVAQYGNGRYSFKIEFDHYDSGQSYYGLDKLSLNNLIQDNTCMKDYLVYQLMGAFGVPAPLCSYAYITVNGQDWGLYLAVEGVEEAFLQRNFGKDYGELYKPDNMDMGGGRGNGGWFDMDNWREARGDEEPMGELPEGMQPPDGGGEPSGELPGGMQPPDGGGDFPGGGPGGMAAEDVCLVYTDDDVDSYPNIFDNAKTDVTDADKARLVDALKRLNEGGGMEGTVFTEEVMRYFVVHNFVCNFDSYTGSMVHNYYLYEEGGQMLMVPWDYNLAFGGFMGAEGAKELVNSPIDTPVSGGTAEERPMLGWVFGEEGYTQQYHGLFEEFLTLFFTEGGCGEMISRARELIAPYVEKDPTKFCTYEEFEAGADALADFCGLRAESIRGQLAGTVPATQEGQAENPEALVDAGDLEISDMGGMGMAGGKGMGGMGPGGGRESRDGSGALEEPPDAVEMPESRQPPDLERQAGQGAPAGGWPLVGVSAAVLAVGAGVVWGYRKKA